MGHDPNGNYELPIFLCAGVVANLNHSGRRYSPMFFFSTTDMLKGNVTNVLPMIIIGGWINWAFSGFVTSKSLSVRSRPISGRDWLRLRDSIKEDRREKEIERESPSLKDFILTVDGSLV